MTTPTTGSAVDVAMVLDRVAKNVAWERHSYDLEIQFNAARKVIDDILAAANQVKLAWEFREQVRGEDAGDTYETGAWRDAVEWLESSARDLTAALRSTGAQ